MGCGVWLVGLGVYFAVLRPPLLPEDARFMGASTAQIREMLPGLERWLRLVFTVMGGFMVGSGLLTLYVAAQPTLRWRSSVLGISGAVTVGLMSAVNFGLGSDYRWLLLIPVLVWVAAFMLDRTAQSPPD